MQLGLFSPSWFIWTKEWNKFLNTFTILESKMLVLFKKKIIYLENFKLLWFFFTHSILLTATCNREHNITAEISQLVFRCWNAPKRFISILAIKSSLWYFIYFFFFSKSHFFCTQIYYETCVTTQFVGIQWLTILNFEFFNDIKMLKRHIFISTMTCF